MFEYEEAIDHYAKALQEFIAAYELPDIWFRDVDHIALKCADGLDYEYTLQDLLADAQQASEANLDGRRLAALCLISPLPVGDLGTARWLEVMEPRPEKLGKDIVGLEHVEFYYPHFDEVRETLHSCEIPFSEQSNPGHEWLNIVLNSQGQELKLSNRRLEEIVAQELEQGIAHLL